MRVVFPKALPAKPLQDFVMGFGFEFDLRQLPKIDNQACQVDLSLALRYDYFLLDCNMNWEVRNKNWEVRNKNCEGHHDAFSLNKA